jgi:peptide-methionine (S)-S-oxide reductase
MNTNLENLETATFGGGCFWCLEPLFDNLKGVTDVVSGYAGGHTVNPTYQQVCSETTGHAEVIQVKFDPSEVSYQELLEVFFTMHDPTTLNRQGNDVGESYRSIILYHNGTQLETAKNVIANFEQQKLWDHKFVTQLEPYTVFYPAEDYHQEYFARNPGQGYCRIIVAPKVAKFRKMFLEKLKV